MDLDQFKKINDLYGHFMGDQVLKQLASRLHSCLRPADTVARLGGDEFAVLLDEIKDVPNALSVVARIQATIQKPFPLSEKGITGTVSIGVSLGTSHTLTPEELLRRGDIAMYRAKARGGGQYVIYDSTLDGSNGRTDNAAAK